MLWTGQRQRAGTLSPGVPVVVVKGSVGMSVGVGRRRGGRRSQAYNGCFLIFIACFLSPLVTNKNGRITAQSSPPPLIPPGDYWPRAVFGLSFHSCFKLRPQGNDSRGTKTQLLYCPRPSLAHSLTLWWNMRAITALPSPFLVTPLVLDSNLQRELSSSTPHGRMYNKGSASTTSPPSLPPRRACCGRRQDQGRGARASPGHAQRPHPSSSHDAAEQPTRGGASLNCTMPIFPTHSQPGIRATQGQTCL